MSKLYIAADQHHKHGMEKIIQQFGFDKQYFFLGDITPHYETIEEGGKDSQAKKRLKELKKDHPDFSYEELLKTYIREDLRRALESYGKAIPYTIARLRFLRENKTNVRAISGNVDPIMDLFLRTLYEETGFGVPTSLDFIKRKGDLVINLQEFPSSSYQEKTQVIELPYSERCSTDSFEVGCRYHPTLILTHENPHPEGVGEKRPAKMQKSIDDVIDKTRTKCSRHVILACGHLHVSGDPYEYRGITVVPLGPDDVMEYDLERGDFKVNKADNH